MGVNWNARSYTKEEFIEAWNSAESVAQVAFKLGCNKNGSGYYTLQVAADELGLTKDHMLGRAWAKGKKDVTFREVRSYDEILVENSNYLSTATLKKRLINDGLLDNKCAICNIGPIWNELPLVLQLDHINGNRRDNRLENLRILCPNCHTQTKTYARKNRAGVSELADEPDSNPGAVRRAGASPVTRTCTCGKSISRQAKMCKSCVPKSNKIEWPTDERLIAMLKDSNYSKLARELGVSDNAIRKRLNRKSSTKVENKKKGV